MYDNTYSGSFAGEILYFSFRHPDTAGYFHGWITPSEAAGRMITVPESDCECWIRDYGMKDDGNTEFGLSISRASDALSHTGRCLIHAGAFQMDGKAYLLAADSGTGKSTQLKHLLSLYGNDIRVINGDKPILRIEPDGMVTVCPSPWKGKEAWGDDTLTAPLGGVILLKQGRENHMKRLLPIDCAAQLLSLMFSAYEKEEDLRALCRIEERILQTVPVWRLVNLGDRASSELLHRTIREWEKGQK